MKVLKRRELELLAKICNQNDVSLKLAQQLLRTSKKLSYENQTPGARIKEYEDIIQFHEKNESKGD